MRLDDIKARHQQCSGDADGEWPHCRQHEASDWPCDAAWLVVRVEELSAALRGVADVHSTVLLRTTHPHCCQYVDEHGQDCLVGAALRNLEDAP